MTVSALFEASIQVLLKVGYRKLTTTRVAERAGVSVGTLYQYFPNRQALISSVVERYLAELVRAVTKDCQGFRGGSLEEIASGLTASFVAAKCKRLDLAQAMHEPLVDIEGMRLVKVATERVAESVAALLRTCSDATFDDVTMVATFTVASCSSLLQAMIADHAAPVEPEELHRHMRAMTLGYLQAMRLTPRRISRSGRPTRVPVRPALAARG